MLPQVPPLVVPDAADNHMLPQLPVVPDAVGNLLLKQILPLAFARAEGFAQDDNLD
jgi:hypothetical protein